MSPKEHLESALRLQSAELSITIKGSEIWLIKWVIGLMIAQTSITIAIFKMIG